MKDESRFSQAGLYPSEIVTISVLFALKGVAGPCLLSQAKPGLWSLVSTVARTPPIVPAFEKSASMDIPFSGQAFAVMVYR
ncbi:hypothetical protein GO003_024765 [Methylicorpusculum oleiharenae]|uniref:hypothetical protein n=1 Tax=Methylicorpusculum oleiharenae TaxID=1338687 RepID=UPI00135CAAF3|nr:hypothetical protein [Methylicorpusculum oleiharenae]MCD2453595.1 hypothetical protein [Methylicorpusculum oleiharenae]